MITQFNTNVVLLLYICLSYYIEVFNKVNTGVHNIYYCIKGVLAYFYKFIIHDVTYYYCQKIDFSAPPP